MDYSSFAKSILKDFNLIQEAFRAKYNIDNYENWYYDQETELLTLSTEEEEINFKYIPVGTYSNKTGTWMWAWENSDSIEESKFKTLKVKELGIIKDYEKLKEGHFESDKYDGWEFMAITNKVLEGIGGYRVDTEHLEKYMLVIEEIEAAEAEKIKEQTITCESHGVRRMAYVCQHLNNETKVGFEEAFPTFKGMELEEDDDFQAWCDQCEMERLRTDGWNDDSMEFANIKVVCEDCFFEMKELNFKK